jgi:acetoin utilization protein AcuB
MMTSRQEVIMSNQNRSSSHLERDEQGFSLYFEREEATKSQVLRSKTERGITVKRAKGGRIMYVRDIMSTNVKTVVPNAQLPELRQTLEKHGFRHLIVRDHGRVVGVVTDRDIKRALPSDATSLSRWEIPLLLEKTTAKELMKHPVITVLEDAPISYAARLMLEEGVSCLPVLFGDELHGIITSSDILRAVAKNEV